MIFDSNFESGNLHRVNIVSLYEYNLFLNVDTNTKGHSLWFYFAVTNVQTLHKVTFNVLNCTKPAPSFRAEMRPWVFSELEFEESGSEWKSEGVGWHKRNDIPRNAAGEKTYYTFSFTYTFKHAGDRVYFAYNRPYTVTMYKNMLKDVRRRVEERARKTVELEDGALQEEIRQFVAGENKKSSKTSRPSVVRKAAGKEEPASTKQLKDRTIKFPESGLADASTLRRYVEARREFSYKWLKSENFQVETSDFVYRQETLCRSFGGFPIELITITATPYLLP